MKLYQNLICEAIESGLTIDQVREQIRRGINRRLERFCNDQNSSSDSVSVKIQDRVFVQPEELL